MITKSVLWVHQEGLSRGGSEGGSTCACPQPHPDGEVGELWLLPAPACDRDDMGASRDDMLLGEPPRERLLLGGEEWGIGWAMISGW